MTYIDSSGNKVTIFKNGGVIGEIEPVLGVSKNIN